MFEFKKILFFYFVLASFWCNAQEISFTQAPENYQLYARGEDNLAKVYFSGKINKDSELNELTLNVQRDGENFKTISGRIQNKEFYLNVDIEAGLYQYKFELNTKT